MTKIRFLIESYLSEKEAEEFAEWAFGKDFKTIDLQHKVHKFWNKLHGDELLLKGEGYPLEDIPKMINLWKKNY